MAPAAQARVCCSCGVVNAIDGNSQMRGGAKCSISVMNMGYTCENKIRHINFNVVMNEDQLVHSPEAEAARTMSVVGSTSSAHHSRPQDGKESLHLNQPMVVV